MKHKKLYITMTAMLFGTCISGTAFSQDENQTAEAADAPVMEEVLVTTRKREESIMEVPIAVTAFTSADIENAGIQNVADVAALTPGFNVAPLFSGDAMTPVIRGLSTTIGEANVGFFVDGVYMGARQTMSNLLGNFIERIEVAKGPQSALYGRNTFGGAINYVTRKPSGNFEGEVEATYGNNDTQALRATLGGPIGDGGFSYRIAAMSDTTDGFYKNELNGKPLDDRDTKSALGSLYWEGESVDVKFNLIYSEVSNGDSPLRFEENNDFFTSFAGLPPDYQMFTGKVPAHTDGFAVTPGGVEREQIFGSVNLDWDLDSMVFTSITGYNDFTHDRATDDDYSANDYHYTTSDNDVNEISQEFRLTSTTDGNLQWMVGAYYYSLDNDTLVNSAYTGWLLPIFGGINSDISEGTDSLAVFGSVDWNFTDTLALNISARYGNEEKSVNVTDTDLRSGASGTYVNKDDWNSFQPRVSLNWQFADDHMAYASWAYAEKAGGFNVVTITGGVLPDERTYDPESSNNYEIGVKSSWADGRVQTTAAAYYIDWTDQIVRAIGGGGAILNTNAGESSSKGVEFELMTQLSDYVDLRMGVSYNDAVYEEYLFAILGAIGMNPALDGQPLQYTPDWTGNISLGFTQPLSSGWEFFTRFYASFTDEQTIVQTGNALVPSTSRFNVRAGWRNENWDVTLWAENLFEPNDASVGVFTGNPSRLPDLFIFGARQGFPAFSPLVTSPDRMQVGLTVRYSFF
ncbi:MAG: TonB-dependent receptor [Proteobacteria bacterium]|nr:TonB-dependent receptor [Pseudomonadota bacterium]